MAVLTAGLLKTREKEPVVGYISSVVSDKLVKITSGQRKITARYSGSEELKEGDRVVAVPSGDGFVVVYKRTSGEVSAFFKIIQIDGITYE